MVARKWVFEMDGDKSFFNNLYAKINDRDIPLIFKLGYKIRAPFYRLLESTIKTYEGHVLSVPDNSVCLELGVGAGGLALELGKRPMKAIAIDNSDEAIALASRSLSEYAPLNVTYLCDNAEQTQFEDQSFDLIYGKWILHHLDLERSLKEIKRLLKPGGKAIFLEPLGANPLIYLFRKATPWLRVQHEHPLKSRDIDYLRDIFKKNELQYYHFLFFLAPFMSVQSLTKMDGWLLGKFAKLRHFCWQVLIAVEKT